MKTPPPLFILFVDLLLIDRFIVCLESLCGWREDIIKKHESGKFQTDRRRIHRER
jgi:hypothetical protein